jgi:UDP-N-acetylmuramyl pentapeptide synthase
LIGAKEDIGADAVARLSPGDWVLVKGSRGMAMETIVETFVKSFAVKSQEAEPNP